MDAARSLGASNVRIIVSHILRNGIAPVLVQLTLDMAATMSAKTPADDCHFNAA